MSSSAGDPTIFIDDTYTSITSSESFHGADLTVLSLSQDILTVDRPEGISLAATTGLQRRYGLADSKPPSRHSRSSSRNSLDITENSQTKICYLDPSTHLVVEPDHTTPLPTHNCHISPPKPRMPFQSSQAHTWTYAKAKLSCFLFRCLGRLYYILFLGLPVFYKNRVHRIFKEVWLSTDEVMEKIIGTLAEDQARLEARRQPALSSAAYFVPTEDVELKNLKVLWEGFIDQSIREWKTANLVSILLLSTIIGTLQIDEAFSDPVVRTAVLMSLICALMSLIYGCAYTVRFSTMRRVHKAFQWANEGERTGNKIFWNTWVLLSMPVTWLSWSLILYLIGIMAFVWVKELSQNDPPKFSLASRIAITCVILVGAVYFTVIMVTLNDYGGKMDGAWREKVRRVAAQRNILLQHSFEGNIQVVPLTDVSHNEPN